jgi:hypothetical protein
MANHELRELRELEKRWTSQEQAEGTEKLNRKGAKGAKHYLGPRMNANGAKEKREKLFYRHEMARNARTESKLWAQDRIEGRVMRRKCLLRRGYRGGVLSNV